MPAFCTHYLFFEELEQWIKDNNCVTLYPKSCAIGTQGPDIFFFHRAIPVIMKGKAHREIGTSLHQAKPEDIFSALLDYYNQRPNPIALSYIYGFILHYALDSVCHPYVYAKEREMTNANKHIHHSSAHNKIEMSLDSYMLYQKKGLTNSKDFDGSSTINCTRTERLEIAKIIQYVVANVLKEEIEINEVITAIEDTIFFQSILRDKHSTITNMCKIIETPMGPFIHYFKLSSMIRPKSYKSGIKYANLEKEIWQSPYDEIENNSSFEELFDLAKDKAKDMIIKFNKNINGNKTNISDNISFLNGLEVK